MLRPKPEKFGHEKMPEFFQPSKRSYGYASLFNKHTITAYRGSNNILILTLGLPIAISIGCGRGRGN